MIEKPIAQVTGAPLVLTKPGGGAAFDQSCAEVEMEVAMPVRWSGAGGV